MKHARRAAYWLFPTLLCLAIYWYGIRARFQADDFAWLGLGLDAHNWRGFLDAMFSPRAQGTIRPWSERAPFMLSYALFGFYALPFRILVFATQCANLLLVASIARRLTRVNAAGFWAAVFWGVNSALAPVLTWSSAYNQALTAFFLLLAFHFLLRFVETGNRRYEVWQWVVFLLGFGAQELNVVYPAIAAAYTWLCARKYFRRTLPLVAVSVIYAAVHMWLVAAPSEGVYVMHYGPDIFRTFATYWSWTVGPAGWPLPPWAQPWRLPAVLLLTAALAGFAAWRATRREWLPAFFLAWYVIVLGPLLPLRDHLTEYYPYIPAIGLAMLGGFAFALAWRRSAVWKAAATLTAAVYLLLAIPSGRGASEWIYRRSRRVERLVLGLDRAHELHPRQTILLHNVDPELFWMGVLDRPYRMFGASVFLTPGSEKNIAAKPEYGDVMEYVLPPAATLRALDEGSAVVYDASGERLRNITTAYSQLFDAALAKAAPRRIDAGNPLLDFVMGTAWYKADQSSRWMPRRATLRIGGPSAGQKLYIHGFCPGQQLAAGPLDLRVYADGIPLAPARIASPAFDLAFDLPASLAGRESIEIALAVSRTIRPPEDGRELGLAFGVFEVK